jgi:transposase InsO family protein
MPNYVWTVSFWKKPRPSSSRSRTGRGLPGDRGGEGHLHGVTDVRAAGGVTLRVLQMVQVPRRRAVAIAAAACRTRRSGRRLPSGLRRRLRRPRILADLRAAGTRVPRKTVAASLRRQGLAGICPRRFAPATTLVDLDASVPADLVGRRFDPGELDRVWTSDITYLRTGESWLYLCAVRDGCSRRVIGWAIDDHMRTDLVESALSMAVAMRGELGADGHLARRQAVSVHIRAAGPVRPPAQRGPLGRSYRGVLG